MKTQYSESDLYDPMREWLQEYLEDKYGRKYNITTLISGNTKLEVALHRENVTCHEAIGLDIQIDVLGIAKNKKNPNNFMLFFIEAKKTNFTLRDLGQLWAYCKLINPKEAFLLTSASFGTLNKVLNVLRREDLLDFGEYKQIKKINVGIWDMVTNSPNFLTMVPKI